MITKVEDRRIDEIHQEEVLLLESLMVMIEKEDILKITALFEQFIDHMQMHFSHEERLMKESGYTMFGIHQAEHYKVLNEARYKFMLWQSGRDLWDIREYFSEDFVEWLHQHIDAMDVPMVAYFKEKGVV